MAKNVEIKAYITDFDQRSNIASSLSDSKVEVINQKDIFFNSPQARLKLRVFSKDRGVLIYYMRSDQKGPGVSHYEISETTDPGGLIKVLSAAYGIRNTVVKTRYLYKKGRTRIHLDRVDALGDFIELEVVLSNSDQLADGEKEARHLMNLLGIENNQLIDCAYIDLLEKKILRDNDCKKS